MTGSPSKSTTSHKNGGAPIQKEIDALGRDAKKLTAAVGDEITAKVGDVAEVARAKSEDFYAAFTAAVTKKPMLSVSIAAVAGVVLATMMQARR